MQYIGLFVVSAIQCNFVQSSLKNNTQLSPGIAKLTAKVVGSDSIRGLILL